MAMIYHELSLMVFFHKKTFPLANKAATILALEHYQPIFTRKAICPEIIPVLLSFRGALGGAK